MQQHREIKRICTVRGKKMTEVTMKKLVNMFRGILEQDGWETCLLTLNVVYKPEIALEVARRLEQERVSEEQTGEETMEISRLYRSRN